MSFKDGDKLKILIVEDDTLLSSSLKTYLESQGVQVETEGRGDKVLDRAAKFQPDAVVLDCMLPGKDGYEVCRDLRPLFPGPILMFTARDQEIDQLLGLGLGADSYLVKPIRPNADKI